MRKGPLKLIIRFAVLWSCPCFAEVVTYPGPAGIVPSDQYAVRITQNGQAKDSFVYIAHVQWRTNRSKTTSWTTFSFAGPATVQVTKLKGSFKTCKILPSSYQIEPRIDGNSVFFELDRPVHHGPAGWQLPDRSEYHQ